MDPFAEFVRPSMACIPESVDRGFSPRPSDQWERETNTEKRRAHMAHLKAVAESYKRTRRSTPQNEEILREALLATLMWSPVPFLPVSWYAVTDEFRFLSHQEGGLLHPKWPILTEVFRNEEMWKNVIEGPEDWLIRPVATNSSALHQPILVRSATPPAPGDVLVLQLRAAAWLMDSDDPDQVDFVATVAWPVLRIPKLVLADVALGAIVDQAFFEVLPMSIMALAPDQEKE